ncbi:MAG: 5-formyltetrahydrofolate cyclo-ligase [Paludibacter sp.]
MERKSNISPPMNALINKISSFFSNKSETVAAAKKEIRQEIRSLKKRLTDDEKQVQSNVAFQKIEALPEFKAADTVLIYWSTPDELSTQAIISDWCTKKQLFLPSIDGEKMLIKRYTLGMINWFKNRWGFGSRIYRKVMKVRIDLVIVPGIAFDS